jgi:hypothetical protein
MPARVRSARELRGAFVGPCPCPCPLATVAKRMLRLVTTLGGLSVACASVRLQSGFVLEDEVGPTTVAASVWYRGSDAPEGSGDNIVGATAAIKSWAAKEQAHLVGPGGDVLTEAAAGTVPLKSYFSEELQDTLTVASSEGLAWATEPDHSYKFLQIEGYCYSAAPKVDAVALTQYWSPGRNDSFMVVAGSSNEAAALNAKYEKKWVECWAAPPPPPATCRAGTDCGGTGEWTTWEDKPPTPTYTNPGKIPFPKSKDLLGWEYKSGSNPGYGGGNHVARSADTWYPSWGADGNLYTPWTDGSVVDDGTGKNTRSGSGRRLQEVSSEAISASSGSLDGGHFTTTGQAIIVGDDPFALNITKVKTFPSSPWPYQGRYPCGSLFYKVCSREMQLHIQVAENGLIWNSVHVLPE